MEEIVKKSKTPALPDRIWIKYGNWEFHTGEHKEIRDLSENDVTGIVEKVRSGLCSSLYLTPDEDGEMEEGFFQLESAGGDGLIFLQISKEEERTAWACFDPDYLDSDGEAPIEPSDGQSVIPMKCTMRDWELAAKCVEWYVRTGEPYPGMDWLKLSW